MNHFSSWHPLQSPVDRKLRLKKIPTGMATQTAEASLCVYKATNGPALLWQRLRANLLKVQIFEKKG